MVVTSLIPILLTIGLGFLLESRRTMDVTVLATITIYALLPSLIFYSLTTTPLTLGEALPVVYVIALATAALWLLGKVVSRTRKLERDEESVFLLTTMFLNAGNMGMPVALYAFGERALDYAVICVLVMNFAMNTLAVYYSSRHRGGHSEAVRTVMSLPSIYAAATAIIMRKMFHVEHFPAFLLDPIHMLGMAVIPVSQLLLGVQLRKALAQASDHLSGAIVPTAIRLLFGPALAFVVVMLLGVHGLAAKVGVLICGMPAGINIAIYTTAFGLQPRRIATVVFVSTLASFVTLSGLLLLLDGWKI